MFFLYQDAAIASLVHVTKRNSRLHMSRQPSPALISVMMAFSSLSAPILSNATAETGVAFGRTVVDSVAINQRRYPGLAFGLF